MQLVIDIPDDEYKILVNPYQHNEKKCERLKRIVMNGTPLPPHGRLIDAEIFSHNVVKYSHQSTKTIGQALADTPSIVEADKERDND